MGKLKKYNSGERLLEETDHVPVRWSTGELGTLPVGKFKRSIIFQGERAPCGAIYEDDQAVGVLETNETLAAIA